MADYYELLGLSRSATADEIKKAFKKKAKQYHPDVNKDSDASSKFKEINEAYTVLSDEKTRAQYDRSGHESYQQRERHGGGSSQGFDFSDMFSEIFRGSRQRKGSDLQTDVTITLKEAYFGVEKEISLHKYDVCSECSGTGAKNGRMKMCSVCDGEGSVLQQQHTPFGLFQTEVSCPECSGSGEIPVVDCLNCKGHARVKVSKKITVDIPAGVDNGQRIRVSGEGEAEKGVESGDLFLNVHVRPHELFTREGDTLHCDVPISFAQAVFGDDIDVLTLDGSVVLEIPPKTQSHTVFRVRDYGMPSLRDSSHGDLLVRVKVETPTKLTKEQTNALKEHFSSKPQKSFFEKLREKF